MSRQSGPMTKVAITIPATINAQLRPISKLCSPFALAKVGVRRCVGDERDYSITADQRPRVRLDPRGNRFFPSPAARRAWDEEVNWSGLMDYY